MSLARPFLKTAGQISFTFQKLGENCFNYVRIKNNYTKQNVKFKLRIRKKFINIQILIHYKTQLEKESRESVLIIHEIRTLLAFNSKLTTRYFFFKEREG
jgi:hypothetical protein